MNEADFKALNSYFNSALEAPNPLQFAKDLDVDSAIKSNLIDLLDCHNRNGDFLTELPFVSDYVDDLQLKLKNFKPGYVLEDFELKEKIGSGAFGSVYRALQISLDRMVALKLTPNVGEEGKTMAQLEHEAIVPIYLEKTLEIENLRLICMPYISGANFFDLSQKVDALPSEQKTGAHLIEAIDSFGLSCESYDAQGHANRQKIMNSDYETACVHILLPVVDALMFAHSQGILHLDVKPGNILVDRYGRSKLADFNISVKKANSRSILGGTEGYMSPEQLACFRGESSEVSETSDVFSFGRLLEFALGPRPSESMQQIIRDCTAESMANRIPNAEELKRVLLGFISCRRQEIKLASMARGRRFLARRSLWTIAAAIFIPQLIGSLFNIAYNHEQIIRQLSLAQRDAFFLLLGPYNLVVYPLCFYLAFRKIWKIYRGLPFYRKASWQTTEQLAHFSSEWLSVGRLVFLISSIGWLPGAFFFPFAIEAMAGELSWEIYGHFALSFVTSWLIASTYSYYLVQIYVIANILPRLLNPYIKISKTHNFGLMKRAIKFGVYPAGAVPLAAALIILFQDPSNSTLDSRIYLAILIVIGILGFTLVHRIIDYLERQLSAIESDV